MRNYSMPQTAECGCGRMPELNCNTDGCPVTMAYVPWQYFENVYEPDKALMVGTIFPELDKPFLAEGRGCRR